jgi:hypothetical protein
MSAAVSFAPSCGASGRAAVVPHPPIAAATTTAVPATHAPLAIPNIVAITHLLPEHQSHHIHARQPKRPVFLVQEKSPDMPAAPHFTTCTEPAPSSATNG